MKISNLGLLLACLGVLGIGGVSSGENVVVEFYSESLCPYCANFVVNHLNRVVRNKVIEIIDLRMIPYGNAHIYENGEIVCQHGEDECKLNIIQSCAIRLWPNVTQWFPFILCLEQLVEDFPRYEVFSHWKSCVEPSGLTLEPLQTCFEGPLGDKFEREFAAQTDSLDPPHKYVPWVVVNGTPLYNDYIYIEKVVCETYQGPREQPFACEKYSGAGNIIIESAIKKGEFSGVCERN